MNARSRSAMRTIHTTRGWNGRVLHPASARRTRAGIRAGLVPPWAALGMLLAATASVIPPRVQLPAIVGGRASPTQSQELSALGGAGKAAAAAVLSPRFVPLGADGQPGLGLNWKRPPVRQAVGSGEAISALYVHSEKVAGPDGGPPETKMVQHETTSARLARGGQTRGSEGSVASTMDAELRQFWSGEGLGSVTKTASLHVEAHKYRGVATISIQPGRAAALFPTRLVVSCNGCCCSQATAIHTRPGTSLGSTGTWKSRCPTCRRATMWSSSG